MRYATYNITDESQSHRKHQVFSNLAYVFGPEFEGKKLSQSHRKHQVFSNFTVEIRQQGMTQVARSQSHRKHQVFSN